MPLPPNLTALTATAITSLPYAVTQNVNHGGVTYPVWYKWRAPVNGELSFFAFGYPADMDPDVYRPRILALQGDDPNNLDDTIISTFGIVPQNRSIQLPVIAGTTYYFNILVGATSSGNPTPALLKITAELFEQKAAPIGSIIVNDDTTGFPCVVISGDDGEVLQFHPDIVAGESGDVLDNGVIALYGDTEQEIRIYSPDLGTTIATLTGKKVFTLGGGIRTCQATQRWWAVSRRAVGDWFAQFITAEGTVGPEHDLTDVPDIDTIAVSNDETILYHSFNSDLSITPDEVTIRRWDLVNGEALSPLAGPGFEGYRVFDILVLADDTIVALYTRRAHLPLDVFARRYAPNGDVLNTYEFGGDFQFSSGTPPRLAFAQDDPASFWVWLHPFSDAPRGGVGGWSRFQEIRAADGVILRTVEQIEYEFGMCRGDSNDDDPPRFGISKSCPFIISRVASGPEPPPPPTPPTPGGPPTNTPFTPYGGTPILANIPIRLTKRQRITPIVSDENVYVRHDALEIDLQAGVGLNTGQGEDPQVILRYSDDSGHTWSDEIRASAGRIGEFKRRVRFTRLGIARNRVYEITVADPVFWVLMNGYLTIQRGKF